MLYGETPNPLYERAVRSHRLHNERWNYPMFVLREQIAGGYWNKPSYLMSLIVQELAKPKSERLEWLMWVDADLILINPSIPVSVFLPPTHLFPDVHFLGNRDQNGLNTGTFFLHVHEWSVKMLAKAIAFPMYRTEIDLGVSMDQEAMAHVFNDTTPYVPKTSQDWDRLHEAENELDVKERTKRRNLRSSVGGTNGEILYQPRVWYNTYEWHHAYEGKKGNLLVHFPGLEDDRWRHMSDWLDVVENTPTKWDVPLEQTMYPDEVKDYYTGLAEASKTLKQADELAKAHENEADQREAVQYLKDQAEELRTLLHFGSDRMKSMKEKVEHVKTLFPNEGT
ncbi:hypothetical protein FH972_025663 [Carpinus fangiana]|uniref:Glycosyltransferase family 34 protein n=1 Tax=Carpinus fangiana TaxID=176857 RepID=A0A5N6L298_9ROSI|nr:hypothetical protein FH972_025663 [Carpinus fangiana]